MKRLGRKSVDVLSNGVVVVTWFSSQQTEYTTTTVENRGPRNTTRAWGRLPYRGLEGYRRG